MKSAEMEQKLKECPFCGGEAFTHILGNEIAKGYYIACDECGAKTKVFGYEAEAIEAWNHRFAPDTNDGSKERKTGTWEVQPSTGDDRPFIWWKCSVCGNVIFSETERDRKEFHAYCGRCGADMREEYEDIPMEYFENGGI